MNIVNFLTLYHCDDDDDDGGGDIRSGISSHAALKC